MNMKKITAVGGIALVGLGLAGCSNEVGVTKNASGITVGTSWGEAGVSVVEVPTDTGSVSCAVLVGGYKGGISCDWENAK